MRPVASVPNVTFGHGRRHLRTGDPGWSDVEDAIRKDGRLIHALLHVVSGRPIELEIFKDDGSRVRQMPAPAAFELMQLPPASRSV